MNHHLITQISNIIFLIFVAGIPLYGYLKKVPVYDTFIEGAKEGFPLVIKIVPYLVAMIVAIGMVRASGALGSISQTIAPLLDLIGMPKEILPLALIRPFSGSASTAMMADIMHTHGGNSYISQVAGTILGSTETTFYIVTVYFGSISITRTRHAIPAGLLADMAGILAALWICRLVIS